MRDVAGLHEPLMPVLAAILATLPHPDGPLLDVGCGTGAKASLLRATLDLAPIRKSSLSRRRQCLRLPDRTSVSDCSDRLLAAPLIGLDCDAAALREAVTRGELPAIAADAHALPLRSACCGAAVCIATLGLLRDQCAALRELRRVVRPSGWVLVVTATTAWVPWSADMRNWMARQCDPPGSLLLTNPEIAADLAALLQESGWNEARTGAFVLEANDDSGQPVLPLLTREAVQRHLTPAKGREYDELVAQADLEILPLILAAVGM